MLKFPNKKFFYRKKFRTILQVAILLTLWANWATACTARPKEHYSSNNYCTKTKVTCWSGSPTPENVVYNKEVCRFYFHFGELSVAVKENDVVQNVALFKSESCVFERL